MGRLVVHVVPRARVTAVVGRHGDAIKIRIAAPPANGAANAELTRFLAERLGVPRSAVTLVSGALGFIAGGVAAWWVARRVFDW